MVYRQIQSVFTKTVIVICIWGCVRPVIGCDPGGEEVVVVYAAAVASRYVSLVSVLIW